MTLINYASMCPTLVGNKILYKLGLSTNQPSYGGTNGTGGMSGGHSNAVGLRLYFDASNRPASVFAP